MGVRVDFRYGKKGLQKGAAYFKPCRLVDMAALESEDMRQPHLKRADSTVFGLVVFRLYSTLDFEVGRHGIAQVQDGCFDLVDRLAQDGGELSPAQVLDQRLAIVKELVVLVRSRGSWRYEPLVPAWLGAGAGLWLSLVGA